MKKNWWKILAVALLTYTIIGGFLFNAPRLAILNETIRALYFHVPMWFGMVFLMATSMFYAILYLRTLKRPYLDHEKLIEQQRKYDYYSLQNAKIGLLFGILGIVTGMAWAKFTWGEPWSGDPKQNAAAVGVMIYLAYLVLRNAMGNHEKGALIAAVYNIFAFTLFIPLIFILPRLTDSMHPGNGGNPGFNAYDLDSKLRMVFYPAVIGWTLLGSWLVQLGVRYKLIKSKLYEKMDQE